MAGKRKREDGVELWAVGRALLTPVELSETADAAYENTQKLAGAMDHWMRENESRREDFEVREMWLLLHKGFFSSQTPRVALFRRHLKETLRAVCPELPDEICDLIWQKTGLKQLCHTLVNSVMDTYNEVNDAMRFSRVIVFCYLRQSAKTIKETAGAITGNFTD